MTQFSKIALHPIIKKEKKETKFHKFVNENIIVSDSISATPQDYDRVILVGNDSYYGDVFICYNEKDTDDFTIVFGEAGDEFKQ